MWLQRRTESLAAATTHSSCIPSEEQGRVQAGCKLVAVREEVAVRLQEGPPGGGVASQHAGRKHKGRVESALFSGTVCAAHDDADASIVAARSGRLAAAVR